MMEDIPLFWGDDEHNDEHPQDFLNTIRRKFIMKSNATDTQKLRVFELHLKSGATAEQWWDELPSTNKDNWDHFCQAFNVRWPVRIPTAKTVGEKLMELEHTTITEEELGTRVKIQGMEEYAHIVWANRIERRAAAIPDTDGLWISKIRKAMPKVLRKVTEPTHTDWASFCKAIRTVTLTQINEAKEEEQEARNLHQEVKDLHDIYNTLKKDITNMFQRQVNSTPSTTTRFSPLQTQLANMQIQHPIQPPSTNNWPIPHMNIVNLYSMKSEDDQKRTTPFQHTIELHGPQGEIVRKKSTFDDGAMVSAVDLKSFQQVKHRLKPLVRSNCMLRMADGQLVPSAGVWNGEVSVGNVSHNGTFEVFDSNGAWSVLFGKPLLKKFKAVHDYDSDIVRIPNSSGNWIELQNQYQQEGDHHVFPSRRVSHTSNNESDNSTNIAHLEHKKNINQPSQVPNHESPSAASVEEEQNMDAEESQIPQTPTQQGNPRRSKEEREKWRTDNNKEPKKSRGERTTAKHNRLARVSSKGVNSSHSPASPPEATVTDNHIPSTDAEPEQEDNVWSIDSASTNNNVGAEQKLLTNDLDKGVFTRHSDPFKTERVDAILSELTIGDDLTEEQHTSIVSLLREFADCLLCL